MRFSPVLFLLPAFAVALTFCSCTDEPSSPVPVITSHEFEWEVDTLPTIMPIDVLAIWGSSQNNVYFGGTTNTNEPGLFRWHDRKWEQIADIYPFYQIAAIDGLDKDYCVFCPQVFGDFQRELIVYDNGNYSRIPIHDSIRVLTTLKVVSRDELYMGGVDGILHYKSGKWTWLLDSTDSKQNGTYEFYPIDMLLQGGQITQFTSFRSWSGEYDKNFLWEYRDGRFSAVDSFEYQLPATGDERFGYQYLVAPDGKFSASSGGIFELTNGKWSKIHDVGSYTVTGSRNNLFAGPRKYILHFNGVDWEDITPYDRLGAYQSRNWAEQMYYKDNTLFVAVDGGGHTIILRGIQK